MEKDYVLALDPEKKLLYRYDLETHEVIFEEILSRDNAQAIENEIKEMEHLRGFELTGWMFDSKQCKSYRQRALNRHLISSIDSKYPAFTTTRELSSAFSNVTDIKLKVDISNYLNKKALSFDEITEDSNHGSQKSMEFNKLTNELIFKVCLVTTVSDAIKQMAKQAYKDYRFRIYPKEGFDLIFKVKGLKEYFTNNMPILAYRQVRIALRGLEYISLTLVEIPKNTSIFRSNRISKTESLLSLKGFLMFYQPSTPEEFVQPELYKPKIFILKECNSAKICEENTNKLLRGCDYEPCFFSGECEWPFRVRLCGVDNLYNLFSEAFRGTATFNGTEKPEHLIIPKVNEKGRENKHARKLSTASNSRKKEIPVIKGKKKNASISRVDTYSARSPYMNHGLGSTSTQELAYEFGLPFAPYILKYDVMIVYGETVLANMFKEINYTLFNYSARPMEWVTFPIKISELPKEARIGVNIYIMSQIGQTCLIGSCVKTIFDEKGDLATGLHSMNIWPFYRVEGRLASMQDFRGIMSDFESEHTFNHDSIMKYSEYAKLFVQFESFVTDIVKWNLKDYSFLKNMYKSLAKPYRNSTITIRNKLSLGMYHISVSGTLGDDPKEEEDTKLIKQKPQIEELAYLEKTLIADPLEDLSDEDKYRLFICRDHYKTLPLALPLFLRSIDWTRPLQVSEAYKMLEIWSPMKPEDALLLLNSDYPDENVRLYAARRINQMTDEDISLYSPQLIQALSFECNHFSALSEMLLERALKSPHQVAHTLYWSLRSQLHLKSTAERFGLFLEQLIMLCGPYRKVLYRELEVVGFYSELGTKVGIKDKYEDRKAYFSTLIAEDSERAQMQATLPLDSSLEVAGLVAKKCRVMKSKKMPLYFTLINSEKSSGYTPIIFKNGDDLRQDILTLQMIRIMDTIWLENGLDLRMKPYQVVATGDQSGIIEIVTESETTSDIHKDYGGALGAFKKNTLKDYLEDNNPGEEQFEKALDNFIRSCAGYCVATYILGIGDRHSGNIMLTKAGHLFHIDFGHFLGNFKKKFGINRERSKFVLTPEMAFVMDGKDSELFKKFKSYCCKAYNCARKHGKRLISLFILMISAGMPELKKKEEIKYLREMLSLKLTEKEANSKFTTEIDNALNNAFKLIDNFFHGAKA